MTSQTTTYTARRYGVLLESVQVPAGQSHSAAWQLVNEAYKTAGIER